MHPSVWALLVRSLKPLIQLKDIHLLHFDLRRMKFISKVQGDQYIPQLPRPPIN